LEQSENRSGGKRLDFFRERLVREEVENSILRKELAQISPSYAIQIKNEDWRSCHEWLSAF